MTSTPDLTATWRTDIEALLSPTDRDVISLSGFGQASPMGRRPALLVIDVTEAFCGDRPEPILESVQRYRNSCGEAAWRAIPIIAELAETARAAGAPVIYTRGMSPGSGIGPGRWAAKNSRAGEDRGDQHRIVGPLEPQPGDVVLDKAKPSGFFGTPLLSALLDREIDSLVVCGCTTSGCVRATVVDAFSHNLPVSVVADGCFDRISVSHNAGLLDMDLKYGNVIGVESAHDILGSLGG